MKNDYSSFSEDEQKILRLADEDNQKMVKSYIEGEEFTKEFISSLNLDEIKRECQDYNEQVRQLKYYQERMKSFTSYIQTIKSWY